MNGTSSQIHTPPGRHPAWAELPGADTPLAEPPGADTPCTVHAVRHGQQADGTHPTGMHNCGDLLIFPLLACQSTDYSWYKNVHVCVSHQACQTLLPTG